VLVLVPEEDEKVAVEGRRWSWERERGKESNIYYGKKSAP
jgi:hypothetical protein